MSAATAKKKAAKKNSGPLKRVCCGLTPRDVARLEKFRRRLAREEGGLPSTAAALSRLAEIALDHLKV